MAALLLVKRGITNIHSARSVADGVSIITSSRYLASQEKNGREKSKDEVIGTNPASHVTDTAKDELERTTDAASKESGDVGKPKYAENEGGDEEQVAVSEEGTVKGENQSGG